MLCFFIRPFICISLLEYLPNIDYLLFGYNLIKGNPVPSRVARDKGFTSQIFKSTYILQETTSDLEYRIPDHLDAYEAEGCVMQFSSRSIFSEQEYQTDLRAHVGISGEASYGIVSASFSASTDYSKMSKKLVSDDKVFVKSEATCFVYHAQIKTLDPPEFEDYFMNAVRRLADEQSYYELIDTFGTHFLTSAEIGARYSKYYQLSKSNREELVKEDINVDLAAEVSVGASFGVGTEVGTGQTDSKLEKFREASEDEQVVT